MVGAGASASRTFRVIKGAGTVVATATILLAETTPVGLQKAFTVTAAEAEFDDDDTLTVDFASGGTAFSAGAGNLIIQYRQSPSARPDHMAGPASGVPAPFPEDTMQIIKNPDGTITIQIPRGDESYDPKTGTLVSEVTLAAKEWETAQKPVEGRGLTWGKAGWLNSLTLPAGLRDLVAQGDSELDYSAGQPDRPAIFKQLDEAATEMGDDAPPVSVTYAAPMIAADEPDHPLGTPTWGASSPAAYRSPTNARNPRPEKESRKAFEQAQTDRAKLSAEDATQAEKDAKAEADADAKAKAEADAAARTRPVEARK